jgi:hypothetical protein
MSGSCAHSGRSRLEASNESRASVAPWPSVVSHSLCSAGPIGGPVSMRPARRSFLRAARATRRSSRAAAFFAVTSRRFRLPTLSGTVSPSSSVARSGPRTYHERSSACRRAGGVCTKQVVERLYVESTVSQPGSEQRLPLAGRDAGPRPGSGGPSATPSLLLLPMGCLRLSRALDPRARGELVADERFRRSHDGSRATPDTCHGTRVPPGRPSARTRDLVQPSTSSARDLSARDLVDGQLA